MLTGTVYQLQRFFAPIISQCKKKSKYPRSNLRPCVKDAKASTEMHFFAGLAPAYKEH